jgi:hypothetical protein
MKNLLFRQTNQADKRAPLWRIEKPSISKGLYRTHYFIMVTGYQGKTSSGVSPKSERPID